jgi:hypothetical protein
MNLSMDKTILNKTACFGSVSLPVKEIFVNLTSYKESSWK